MSDLKQMIADFRNLVLGKQDKINDLEAIRDGASKGSTAIQQETDPTVPAWAKQSVKPSYTAREVGALPDTTVIPTVPTKISEFENDSGYLTDLSMNGYAKKSDIECKNLIGNEADKLYYAYVPAGTKWTISTSDGKPTTKRVQINMHDKAGNVFNYWSLFPGSKERTVVDYDHDIYWFSIPEAYSVPIQIEIGSRKTDYVKHFDNAETKIKETSFTKVSELVNDAGYAKSSDIPNVPTKVSELENDAGYVKNTEIPNVPTKVSELENDEGYAKSSDIPNVPTKVSELENDEGYIGHYDMGVIIGEYQIAWNYDGYISKDDGSVNYEEGSVYSDFIKVEPNSSLVFTNTMTTDTFWNAFYDADKNFISNFSNASGSIYVPNNARYFRLSKYASAILSVSIGDIMNTLNDLNGMYDKYSGRFISIENSQNGIAELIKFDDSMIGHTVTICGKNLFNIEGNVNVDLSTGLDRYDYVIVKDGVLTTLLYSYDYHPNGQRLYNMLGKTISISANVISANKEGYIGVYENGEETAYDIGSGVIKIENYVCQTDNPIIGVTTSGSSGGAQFKDIQVEIGENKTDFEPYRSYAIDITSNENQFIKTYSGHTSIYNDCGENMTVLVNKAVSENNIRHIVKSVMRDSIYDVIAQSDSETVLERLGITVDSNGVCRFEPIDKPL